MKRKKWVRHEWGRISAKFARQHDLPHGTSIVLVHQGSGRQARSDRVFKHRPFKGRASGEMTITEMVDQYLRPRLSVDLRTHGLKPKLIGPNGERPQQNMKVRTVRGWPPRPTQAEIEAYEFREAEIEEVQGRVFSQIRDAQYCRDAEDVLTGHVRALATYFSVAEIRAELEAL